MLRFTSRVHIATDVEGTCVTLYLYGYLKECHPCDPSSSCGGQDRRTSKGAPVQYFEFRDSSSIRGPVRRAVEPWRSAVHGVLQGRWSMDGCLAFLPKYLTWSARVKPKL